MAKLQKTDEVMQELWAIKDATAAKFATVSAYFSHLRELGSQRKTMTVRTMKSANSTDLSPSVSRRKAI